MISSFRLCILISLISASLQYESRPQRSQSQTSSETTPTLGKPPVPQNNNGQIEYRLSRLEIILVEKLDNVRAELRETTRRLQAVEWQSAEFHSTLEGIRADLNKMVQQAPAALTSVSSSEDNSKLEQKMDTVAKGVQILVAANIGVVSDIAGIKTNLSTIAADSKALLKSTSQLVTKQFFNNGILDLKHRQVYYPWSQQIPMCPAPSSTLSSSGTPKSCKEIADSGQARSGLYRIKPEHASSAFMVVCDLETQGGGWTVIQNRFDGSQDFYQNWHEYKHGFGNLGGEFWLGLDHIHQITGEELNELLIELQDSDLQNKSALYTAFSIGPEVEGYPIKVLGGYSGDAGDSLSYHAGSRFSTKDMDQDGWPEGSCAQAHGGAWWYRNCDMSNLNGKYLSGQLPEQYIYQGMYWGEFRGPQYSLSRSKILVRPREQVTHTILDEIFNSKVR